MSWIIELVPALCVAIIDIWNAVVDTKNRP